MSRVLLTQPNYSWLGKRTWASPPYTLALLSAAIRDYCDPVILDPNFHNLSGDEIIELVVDIDPSIVGITSSSTEYTEATQCMVRTLREAIPSATLILGGVIPTVATEYAEEHIDVDHLVVGEGEYLLRDLVKWITAGITVPRVVRQEFRISDLDCLPYPDYSNIIGRDGNLISLTDYGSIVHKYAPGMIPRNYPFATTITSRGCPYQCIFCAASTMMGRKIRVRSAEDVLGELELLYQSGIREIIFVDDHFFTDKARATGIMYGISRRFSGMTWKCCNLSIWSLDRNILMDMYNSGCDFMVVSIESGDQWVLDNIVRKPVKLDDARNVLECAKGIGFDVIVNFVIGFPGETWDQIRSTFRYAESTPADMVNFHIATPLPQTQLLEECIQRGILGDDYMDVLIAHSGYSKGIISTDEFTPFELSVLRAFEWDRINFSSEDRAREVARINGITMEELGNWRVNTRRNLGVTAMVDNLLR